MGDPAQVLGNAPFKLNEANRHFGFRSTCPAPRKQSRGSLFLA
jgi:hypothetical protein